MERLQSALQKARERRRGGLADRAKRSTAGNQSSAAYPQVEGDLQSAWSAITPLELSSKNLRSNLIAEGKSDLSQTAPFDLLRTRLVQMVQQNNWRRIAVVSAVAGEGKSLVTLNLSFALARQNDLRICVYDMDLRRPSLCKKLGLADIGALSAVFHQERDFDQHARRFGDNLIFALNSEIERNPSELLQSRTTIEMLEALEDAYRPDIELFDMPPMSAVDDAHGFLTQVDAAIIVAEAESTSIKQIDVAERQVAALTQVAGVVLNKCNFTDGIYGMDYEYY